MEFYNTLSNRLEKFVPLERNKVKMYVCGPTVYNYIHLGNARPIIVFDVLARYFKYKNYEVEFVQNFTDIDDKIINRANEEKLSCEEITKKYIDGFFEDVKKLNILSDVKRPKVTENIYEIIETIKKLIDNGFAYEKDGDVYFEVKKYSEYGKLSNQKVDELEAGARIDISKIKKNPLDFVLWKSKKENEPFFESPWGKGRPGWHIECSAMSQKYLGDTFDIHGGGQDLIFPHHENEIAQSKCAYHGNFANYWLHNGFVQIDGDKMSKSTGNFFLLREILEKFSGNVIRLFMISTHYRKPINFSFEALKDTKKTLQNIVNAMNQFESTINLADKNLFENKNSFEKIEEFDKKFVLAMDEDMNTPQALAAIFEQIKYTNKLLSKLEEEKEIVLEVKKSCESLKNKIENVLGIDLKNEKQCKKNNDELTDKLIELLLEVRKSARVKKDFELSDKIRDSLKDLGIEIKDTKDGNASYSFKD